jgi:catechol 2,3-dioxygenase-like lactoylglutathione lyase family enzyme
MPSSSLSSHGKALCLERLQAAGAKAASKAELDVTYDQPKELIMSTTEMSNEQATNIAAAKVDMKLEVVVIPVSDVERAKRFYSGLGWRLDADFVVGDTFRAVQFTPPGSPCSIHFGTGITPAEPGSVPGIYLVVSDIEAARADLVNRGVDVKEVIHRAGPGKPPLRDLDPERRSYASFASFSDPDGNAWLLQEVTMRLPGRVDADETTFNSSTELASALRRAEAAHGEHEKRTGQRDAEWPIWYAEYMIREQAGKPLPT